MRELECSLSVWTTSFGARRPIQSQSNDDDDGGDDTTTGASFMCALTCAHTCAHVSAHNRTRARLTDVPAFCSFINETCLIVTLLHYAQIKNSPSSPGRLSRPTWPGAWQVWESALARLRARSRFCGCVMSGCRIARRLCNIHLDTIYTPITIELQSHD